MKRTAFDFSNHEHRVEIFKSSEGNEIRVDHLQENNSRCGYVKFVNDNEGMSVYGDFGNWIFCRPFHPSADGEVSEMYWNAKLQIYSCQKHTVYDPDETWKEIEGLIDGGLEEYGFEGEELDKVKDWFTHLLGYVHDEVEYTYHAFRTYAEPIDIDLIPFCEKGSNRLLIIFDAFEEICDRIKKKGE